MLASFVKLLGPTALRIADRSSSAFMIGQRSSGRHFKSHQVSCTNKENHPPLAIWLQIQLFWNRTRGADQWFSNSSSILDLMQQVRIVLRISLLPTENRYRKQCCHHFAGLSEMRVIGLIYTNKTVWKSLACLDLFAMLPHRARGQEETKINSFNVLSPWFQAGCGTLHGHNHRFYGLIMVLSKSWRHFI